MRHHQPHRAAMFPAPAVRRTAVREQGVFGGKIFQLEMEV